MNLELKWADRPAGAFLQDRLVNHMTGHTENFVFVKKCVLYIGLDLVEDVLTNGDGKNRDKDWQ